MTKLFAFALLLFLFGDCYGTAPYSSAQGELKCYNCQRSMKTGYTSPFNQDCTFEYIRNKDYKYFLNACKGATGCAITEIKEFKTVTADAKGELIAESRACSIAATRNEFVTYRYCRGNDCTATEGSLGTAVASGVNLQCRVVSGTQNATLATATAVSNCPADTTTVKQYCYKKTISADTLVDNGNMLQSNLPFYEMGCAGLNTAQWTEKQYIIKTKNCVNDLCNLGMDTKSAAAVSFSLGVIIAAIFAAFFA